ncbi:MAG: hypothetical protein GY832_43785 [Chloroflexi bacterium]|nr:hypothetical protein [Chloroflexota bacterium]
MSETEVFVYERQEDWWTQLWSTIDCYFLEKIQGLGKKSMDSFRDQAYTLLQDYERDDGFHLGMSVIFAVGVNAHKSKDI